jgi:hypothetical protein
MLMIDTRKDGGNAVEEVEVPNGGGPDGRLPVRRGTAGAAAAGGGARTGYMLLRLRRRAIKRTSNTPAASQRMA